MGLRVTIFTPPGAKKHLTAGVVRSNTFMTDVSAKVLTPINQLGTGS